MAMQEQLLHRHFFSALDGTHFWTTWEQAFGWYLVPFSTRISPQLSSVNDEMDKSTAILFRNLHDHTNEDKCAVIFNDHAFKEAENAKLNARLRKIGLIGSFAI